MVLMFLENALNLAIFTHNHPYPPPFPPAYHTQNSQPSSYHHTVSRQKLFIPLVCIF